jgi:fructokinase
MYKQRSFSMFDVVALGELLIDFTPAGLSPAGMRLFEQNPGGAPANVVVALANMGVKCAFVGKVGADMHGDFLRAVLSERGIDTSGLIRDSGVFTTLSFVSLSEKGERSFSFARRPGADTCLKPEELRPDILGQCKIFHFGSLSLTDEPSRSATLAALNMAKKAGAIIAYDPNYRAPLWPSVDAAIAQMRSVLPLVDCVKISDEEISLITGEENYEKAADALLAQGAGCAVITLGKNGA